jgi:hypothetical protein
MEVDAVISQIRAAFPVQPMPSMTLHQAQLADQSMSRAIDEAEWEAVGNRDRAVAWTDIPRADLLECDAALSHLDEEGFVYYIPAYMVLALRHFQAFDGYSEEAFGATVFHLAHRENHSLARFKRMTDPQIEAVIEFLRVVQNTPSLYGDLARKALKRYWETPESRRRTIIHAP